MRQRVDEAEDGRRPAANLVEAAGVEVVDQHPELFGHMEAGHAVARARVRFLQGLERCQRREGLVGIVRSTMRTYQWTNGNFPDCPVCETKLLDGCAEARAQEGA